MPRRAASFTRSDIARACKAAPDRVVEVKLPDGTVIRLIPDDSQGENPQFPKERLEREAVL